MESTLRYAEMNALKILQLELAELAADRRRAALAEESSFGGCRLGSVPIWWLGILRVTTDH